ncbi:hypothetical protein [Thalassospira xiamenensis]|uniref:Uncharacterized protein n=1 Tax=Thalassospira xiamenensis TaxID=220697 RepID=A0A285TQ43_9PROT|nr:hypothetical protein [Thalassospira xiamenensis]SOC23208.1 hypothetical protein SAMN05428964_10414 [Thalassospira xiamenensis]
MNYIEKIKENFRYNHLPKLVDWVVHLSNSGPRKLISQSNASKILIDNSVIGHGIIQETGWISTGQKLWGDTVSVETGYAARIPVYSDDDKKDIASSVKYLPCIIDLAKSDKITLFRSVDLRDEADSQPRGRYAGYEIFDFSLFNGINMPILPDSSYSLVYGLSQWNGPTSEEQISARRKHILESDPRVKELAATLGKKNSQDAIHIATAERNGCYCFLTMDFRLIKNIKSQKGHPAIKSLKTKIMTPEEYGKRFKIKPFLTRFYSYHNASFPVEHSKNWQESERKGRNKK